MSDTTPEKSDTTVKMTPGFEWIDLYTEIANEIHEKFSKSRDQPKNGKEFVKNVFNEKEKDFVKGKHNPFALFASFNYQGLKDQMQKDILKKITDALDKKPLCDKLSQFDSRTYGVPAIQPRSRPFDGYQDEDLWRLFDAAISYANSKSDEDKRKFEEIYGKTKITPTITMILFQMRPDVFLTLDSNMRAYLKGKEFQVEEWDKKKGRPTGYIKCDSILGGTMPPAAQFLELCEKVRKWVTNKCQELGFSANSSEKELFAQLSRIAWESTAFAQAFELLESNHQVILTGAPGTGKTHTAKQVAKAFVDENKSFKRFTKLIPDFDEADVDKKAALKKFFQARLDLDFVEKLPDYDPDKWQDKWQEKLFTARVQFHPGYDYSDFVIGMKPILIDLGSGKPVVKENGSLVIKGTSESPKGTIEASFIWENGAFKKFADRARTVYDEWCKQKDNDPKEAPRFVFIIDEINRADLSRVFGELFSLLEESYRYSRNKKDDEKSDENSITLPNGDEFVIPENLYIIGTMNDIDRSVESMDFALRRRFAWLEVAAAQSECILDAWAEEKGVESDIVEKLKKAMEALNKKIREDKDLKLGPEYELGGAYFKKFGDGKTEDRKESYERLWDNHLRIILSEYLRGNQDRKPLLDALHQVYIEGCGFGKGKKKTGNDAPGDGEEGTPQS